MNNSFDRILVGLIETLRHEVLPNLEGEFVRGQTFGVIYMLNFLRLRASWSTNFLGPQLEDLDKLTRRLTEISGLPAAAPRPRCIGERPTDEGLLEALRDEGDAAVSELIDWVGTHGEELDPEIVAATNEAVMAYIKQQLRHELKTSARPMFAEISLGKEQNG